VATKKVSKTAARGSTPARRGTKAKRWSAQVTKKSDALDLQSGVFKLKSPRALARSLKKSAERSQRRKSTPFRSAMSMLNFEINRASSNLTLERKRVLNEAKQELRKLFGRPAA
jgi:hypothetical protein